MEPMQPNTQSNVELDEAAPEAGGAALGTGPSGPPAQPSDGEAEALRAGTYGLLASLLAQPPSEQLLDQIARIAEPAEEVDEMATAWRVLKLAAGRSEVEPVDDEFHDLFIGVGRGELVPYGSWYLTGYVMDRPLALLRADLESLGIERSAETSEPEDHAAALCETMALLITSEDTGPEDERRFFAQHMQPWFDVFFRDLQTAKAACFYRAVGRLGQAFMELESRYLAMAV